MDATANGCVTEHRSNQLDEVCCGDRREPRSVERSVELLAFSQSSSWGLRRFAMLAASQGTGPAPGQIRNLVPFGDSYPDIVSVGDGGVAWPVYAAGYANLSLFPFAKSGATCSNNITFRPFPSVFESQLPTYFSEVQNGTLHLDANETIYTLWIGTNDVGESALLTGNQVPGVTIVDTTTCAVNWLQTLYDSGARNFIFQNVSFLSWSEDKVTFLISFCR